MKLKRSANLWLPVMVLLLLIGMTFLNLELQQRFSTADSFAPRWAGARVWLTQGASPYSEVAVSEAALIQADHGFEPDPFDQGRVMEPVFYTYLFLPFSLVNFTIARAIWMTLSEVALIASVLVGIRLTKVRFHPLEQALACLLLLVWFPLPKLILSASILLPFVFVVLLACAEALELRSTSAGVLFFGMVPESLFLVIFCSIWLAARRDMRLLQVYLVGLFFLIGTSLILFPGWIGEWFSNFIRLYPTLNWIDTPLMRLAAVVPTGEAIIAITLHILLAFLILVEWYGLTRLRERQILWKLLLTLNLVYFFNLTSHGAYLLWAIPALLMGFRFVREKWLLFGRIVSWLSLFSIVYIYFHKYREVGLFSLREPTLAVLLLPLITLMGLHWFRWWATESPRPIPD